MTAADSLQVACAIIERDSLVLAVQRSEQMRLPLKWEFPGGKIHPGENAAGCLARELREELGVEVSIGAALPSFRHDYPDFSVTLHPFRCTLASDRITLHEHKALRWMRPGELRTLDWAEADIPIIDHYCSL